MPVLVCVRRNSRTIITDDFVLDVHVHDTQTLRQLTWHIGSMLLLWHIVRDVARDVGLRVALLDYFEPLTEYLRRQNAGRKHTLPDV